MSGRRLLKNPLEDIVVTGDFLMTVKYPKAILTAYKASTGRIPARI